MTTPITTTYTTSTPPTSTICPYGMETITVSPLLATTANKDIALYMVAENSGEETVVDIDVTSGVNASILTLSDDLEFTPTLSSDEKAIIIDLGTHEQIPSEVVADLIRKLNTPDKVHNYLYISNNDGPNMAIVRFEPNPEVNYQVLLNRTDTTLYDIDDFESVDQVPEGDEPAIILADEDATVQAKKCSESTTFTTATTTFTTATTTMPPTTITTTVPPTTGPTICAYGMEAFSVPAIEAHTSNKDIAAFVVTPNAGEDTIVELAIQDSTAPYILTPSSDLEVSSTLANEQKAIVFDIGENTTIPSSMVYGIQMELNTPSNVHSYVYLSDDGHNLAIIRFYPNSSVDYQKLFEDDDEAITVFDVDEYTSVDQIPEGDLPAIILAESSAKVFAEKCKESITTMPTTTTTTITTTMPPTTIPTTMPTTTITTQTTTPTTTETTTICTYGENEFEVPNVQAQDTTAEKPVLVELSADGGEDTIMEITTTNDSNPLILSPVEIEKLHMPVLNAHLTSILPTSTSQTPYAAVFKTGKTSEEITTMFSESHILGKVWNKVFPTRDTYVYPSANGVNTVVTVFREVMEGRKYFGTDFWYSSYYLTGKFSIPDLFKVMPYSGLTDVHKEDNKPVIMLTDNEATTIVRKCTVPTTITPPTTPSTTTVTTTIPPTTTTITTVIMPTTITPTVCEDITYLTSSTLEELPLSEIKIQPEPSSKESDFEFSSTSGTPTMEYSITAEKGAVLMSLKIDGSFISYQVFETSENGTKVGPAENTAGNNTFEPSDVNTFNKNISEGNTISLVFTGPTTGFVVNVTQFSLCLPEFKYCRLSQEEVLRELKMLPLSGILGQSVDDGADVEYGLNMEHGDILEEGTVVKGNCYECECKDYKLVCTIDESCVCPNYTTKCEGPCDNPVLVVEFDVDGVDPKCKPNDTCTPQTCTTPHDCPSTWGEWSECSNCMRNRERTCSDSCGSVCTTVSLTETDICGECTTTTRPPTTFSTYISTTREICDGDNEEYKCYSHYIMCNETCRSLYNQDACSSLQKIDEDMPCTNYSCACIDNYKRNDAGDCVKAEECECYNGTIPLPVNYRENISQCKYCECTIADGYLCHEIDSCCEVSEWGEWSDCTVTCGTGVETRTRTVKSGNCENEELTETKPCTRDSEDCLCILEGIIYQPGEILDDECKYCQCLNGEMDCQIKNDTTKFHPTCSETCYCVPETGAKVCVNASSECGEDPAVCNNLTHHQIQDPDRPCCLMCAPRVRPCEKHVQEIKRFNFTDETRGICVSPSLEVGVCEGGCGFSLTRAEFFKYNVPGGSQLPLFDLDVKTDCSCCQAQLTSASVDFLCANQETVTITVTQIDSCKCNKCQ